MAFPSGFAHMFTSDPALIEYGTRYMRIYFAVLFIFGAQMACQMTFVSIGYSLVSIIVAVVRKFVLLVPLIYLLPLMIENKVLAVYLAEPIADILAVTFTITLFAIEFNKALKKLNREKEEQLKLQNN